jgi:protocatechuate 3,4-dioxygenase beta subunit
MPQSVISGRVIDEDGDPMARVQVEALQYHYMQGKKQLLPSGGASTNDLGEYRIFGLRAGKYFLRATDREMGMGRSFAGARPPAAAEEGYAPAYYPGASDVANAAALTLTPGMEMRSTDVRLVKTRAVRIRGSVVSPDGRTRQGMAVMLLPLTGMPFSRMAASVQDAQGHFEFHGVTPGSYVLMANSYGDGLRYSGRQAIEVGNGNLDGVQITLLAPIDFSAHVKAEGNAEIQFNQVRLFLEPVLQSGMGGGLGAANADGDITVKNLAPAEYRPRITVPPGFYVKSIRYGDTDALDSGIDLSNGAPGQLEIVLSPAGGEVDGSVANDKGEPSAGAMVTLVPEGPRRASSMFFKSGTSDQTGHFTFKDVAPGEYTVYAWDQVDQGAVQDPDFLKPFEDKGKKLKIEEKARENITLEMIPAASMNQQP